MDNWKNMVYPWTAVPLNYGFSGLEPFIDTATMKVHYEKHLGNYIANLNAAVEANPQFMGQTLEQLINYVSIDENAFLDNNVRTAILRNAGGVFNHFFYFDELRPFTGNIVIGISQALLAAASKNFGGMNEMKRQVSAAAMSVFGSGYAWLVKSKDGRLDVVTTKDQTTTLPDGLTPLLAIDVWEHAYYLKHKNERDKYLEDFWNVVDWAKLSAKI
ncbi:MAG: superoxide dismutase [Christensenellaceae bacterium]|jgi:Fe-Mn family superoxide dismutase|nr:superoxide dismutase [Christensenellaceae bacterium]